MADGEIKVVFTAEASKLDASIASVSSKAAKAATGLRANLNAIKIHTAEAVSLSKIQEAQAKAAAAASVAQSQAMAAQAKASKELLSLEEKRAQAAERAKRAAEASFNAAERIANLAGKGRKDIREEARFMWASKAGGVSDKRKEEQDAWRAREARLAEAWRTAGPAEKDAAWRRLEAHRSRPVRQLVQTPEEEFRKAELRAQRKLGESQAKMAKFYQSQSLGPSIMEAQRWDLLSKYRAPYSGPPPPKLGGGPQGAGDMSGLSALSASGIPYLSTVARAVTSGLGMAALAAAATLRALSAAVNKAIEAMTNAASTYAKQLQSGGMPTSFVVRRENLAKILGVGENEVFQFGSAVAYLNGKLALADGVLASTNRALTSLTWEWRVLMINIGALFASLAAANAAPLREFVSGLNNIVKAAIKLAEHPAIKKLIEFGNSDAGVRASVVRSIGSLSPIEAAGKMIVWAIRKAGGGTSDAPMANVGINRLPASSWEKMGLVIGMTGNPAAETARNTRRTADRVGESNTLLQDIAAAIKGLQLGLSNAP